ncbi:MAG: hypothetical protein C0518_15610 [Opitutus sp.]|nr:hypothetical protein [Opitutus sp.]
MPTKSTRQSARRRAQRGNKSSTQAGAYVREEMHKFKRGRGNAQSRKQAVAIGLSEAREDGVRVKGRRKRKSAPSRSWASASKGKPRRSTGGRRGSARK